MSKRREKQKPFPWRCPQCARKEVRPRATNYTAQVKHDGRIHEITIENLEIPTCPSCGERVFSRSVDGQISQALRSKLTLLSPAEIRDKLRELALSQKELASRLGVAEATFSRWLTGAVIQSRALDNLMRVYFAFPEVRQALIGEQQNRQLGLHASEPDPA